MADGSKPSGEPSRSNDERLRRGAQSIGIASSKMGVRTRHCDKSRNHCKLMSRVIGPYKPLPNSRPKLGVAPCARSALTLPAEGRETGANAIPRATETTSSRERSLPQRPLRAGRTRLAPSTCTPGTSAASRPSRGERHVEEPRSAGKRERGAQRRKWEKRCAECRSARPRCRSRRRSCCRSGSRPWQRGATTARLELRSANDTKGHRQAGGGVSKRRSVDGNESCACQER